MSARLSDSPFVQVVKAMKATGNQSGLIEQWKNSVAAWAMVNNGPDADAVLAMLPLWQVRPFYTAAELAPIFPALAVTLGFARRFPHVMAPARLANCLDFANLPRLPLYRDYFIVERIHYWSRGATFAEMQEAFNAQYG